MSITRIDAGLGKVIKRVPNDISRLARQLGIKIIRAKTAKDGGKIGIHLLEPDRNELERALERAEANLFPVVYIHNFRTWRMRA